jgi:hypothetical protein
MLIALAVLAYHVAPLFREIASWAKQWDARYFWFVLEVDRTTILEHGQLPLWNPYYCGGAPHLANPQSSSLSPLNLIPLLLGMPLGYRVGYALGLLTALLALRAFARTLGLGEAASTVAGAGYALCGALAQHMGGGHWAWIGFALHPLLLRSLHLAVAGRRAHVVWGGLVLALIILHAPIYPMAFGLVVLGVYALLLGLERGVRDWRRVLSSVGTALVMAIGSASGRSASSPSRSWRRRIPAPSRTWTSPGRGAGRPTPSATPRAASGTTSTCSPSSATTSAGWASGSWSRGARSCCGGGARSGRSSPRQSSFCCSSWGTWCRCPGGRSSTSPSTRGCASPPGSRSWRGCSCACWLGWRWTPGALALRAGGRCRRAGGGWGRPCCGGGRLPGRRRLVQPARWDPDDRRRRDPRAAGFTRSRAIAGG